jgi:hypothetical protein
MSLVLSKLDSQLVLVDGPDSKVKVLNIETLTQISELPEFDGE